MVDPVVNKGKVTVSTGYNSTATSIVLATGQGAELPDPVVDGEYNLPWWDSTNYNDPADDPNFEIVRVTGPAGTGDTKTIVRAQEGTAATNKNNADATYKMHLGVTAKTITDVIAIENTTGMEDQSFTNLIRNGDFESWSAGVSSAPDSWLDGGTLASIAQESTIKKIGKHSVKCTPDGSADRLYQGLSNEQESQYAGVYLTLGCWVYSSTPNSAKIRLADSGGSDYSAFHTGGGGLEWLSVSRLIGSSVTYIQCSLYPDKTNGTELAYFDGVMLVEGKICPAFSPKPLSASDLTIHMQTPQTLTGAGAVDIVSDITHIVTTGADALTLVDGAEGQEKYIVMKTDDGDGTLTPSNLGNGTTITFDAVGDSAHLLFTNGAWHYMGGTATLA